MNIVLAAVGFKNGDIKYNKEKMPRSLILALEQGRLLQNSMRMNVMFMDRTFLRE